MSNRISRRDFIQTGTVVTGLTAASSRNAFGRAPAIQSSGVRPVVIASGNGHRIRNGGSETCVETAFRMMTEGEDVLESLIAGVNLNVWDPEDGGVGFGGSPNADGIVQLDSCCMHGPKRRAGGVAGIEGVKTPSLVAHAVMQHTDHHLLVGQGAQDFARNMGFTIHDDLNTDRSRERWLEWKRRIDPGHYLNPAERARAGYEAGLGMMADGRIDEHDFFGTINCDGINSSGEICGVTTTSGLAWKIPGLVGDSPILGA